MRLIEAKEPLTLSLLMKDFLQLTKFRLAVSVVISSLAGYLLAAERLEGIIIVYLFLGGYAMVGASNAFNQWMEKELDALMQRTQNRPLPSGRMQDSTALFIASGLTLIGILFLGFINFRTAFFGALSIFIYVCIYTPLKRKTPLAVFVGAFPGAIPFMLGWVAATNKFGIEPGLLFMIQFLWQFPHFWAIGWVLDADYKKAGFKLLPSGKTDRVTAFQIVFYTLWVVVVSLVPAFHYTGTLQLSPIAAFAIGLLGLIMLFFAMKLMKEKTKKAAQNLIGVSILYITALQLIYVIDKYLTL
ncbi:MAG: heme o synthase [Flavobacteriaceae bacterium]|jgi:protoheme IX farnesyltransferase